MFGGTTGGSESAPMAGGLGAVIDAPHFRRKTELMRLTGPRQ